MTESRVTVALDLDYDDLRFLERVTRMQVRKVQRRNEKSTFVPEPGKRHGGAWTLARGEDLLARLRDAMAEVGPPATDTDDG